MPAALALFTFLLWARSLAVPIHEWDDSVYLFRDARLEAFTWEHVRLILTQAFYANFHPLTTLTYAFDRAVWGTWVPGFHITQLAFYVGGVLGLYFLFVRLLRSPPSTDDPHQLRALLFRIASRLIIDHWRRSRHERGRPDESAARRGGPEVDIPLRLDMARVFEQLNPQQRQLMWLAYVEGADHREIAAALGLRERSVRVLLHRTRRKLARLLREGGRGPEAR